MFHGGTMKFEEEIYCDKCESQIFLQPNPDNALNLKLTGGYAMFVDLTEIDLTFCHDCTVELFRSIPSLSADKIGSQHSVRTDSKDYPLCCEYSWTYENNQVVLGTKTHFDNKEK
jgi:hypothetical protein